MKSKSLEKAKFLKAKLVASEKSFKLPENPKLKGKLEDFNKKFKHLIKLMEETIDAEILITENTLQDDVFLNKLTFNRGDINKNRFITSKILIKDKECILQRKKLKLKSACIEDQISRLTKELVEAIEDENLCPALVEAYRKHKIYEILYHNGVIGHYAIHPESNKNNQNLSPLGPKIMKGAIIGLGFATLSVAFFATVVLLGLSGGWIIAATALFGSAVAYMAGLLYGIINDMFATKANLPYFLLGHRKTQYSFFVSNDRLVQAIGWGIIAAHPIAIIAAIVFGVTIAAVMASAASPVLTFVLPILLVAVPTFAVCANFYANYSAKKYIQQGIPLKNFPEQTKEEIRKALNLNKNDERIDLDQVDFDLQSFREYVENIGFLNDYQLDGIALMSSSKTDKANWLANINRNALGYKCTPLIAITGLVLMLSLTSSAPAVLFSPLMSTIIPLVAAGIAIVCLATALTYVTINQDKQIDNRYKLFTSGENGEKKMDELYVTDEQLKELSRCSI